MAIVSGEDIEAALAYLNEDPHPLAMAIFNATLAANKADQVRALCFVDALAKTVAEKEALVELDERYIGAQQKKAEATLEENRHKARKHSADKLIDVWKNEIITARIAEKVF